MIYRRKTSVQEIHQRGEETFSKKKELEEIIVDLPKPREVATQQKNMDQMFLMLSKLIAMIFKCLELL